MTLNAKKKKTIKGGRTNWHFENGTVTVTEFDDFNGNGVLDGGDRIISITVYATVSELPL